jgi:hypothetical protein
VEGTSLVIQLTGMKRKSENRSLLSVDDQLVIPSKHCGWNNMQDLAQVQVCIPAMYRFHRHLHQT